MLALQIINQLSFIWLFVESSFGSSDPATPDRNKQTLSSVLELKISANFQIKILEIRLAMSEEQVKRQ